MYLMTCTRPDLAYPLSLLARYVAPGRHRKVHWDAAKRVLRYLCSTSGMGLVLGGWARVVLTGHADASWVDDLATQRSSQGYTFSLGSGSVSWRSTRSSSVLSSSCEAEIYAGAMAAQELRWLTYLPTDLGEAPRSPPVLYANTADVFTKALQPCDHQPCFPFLDWSCDLLFSPTLPMGILADKNLDLNTIAQLGRWDMNEMHTSYVIGISRPAIQMQAGFSEEPGDYYIRRSKTKVPLKVLKAIEEHIFPKADLWLIEVCICRALGVFVERNLPALLLLPSRPTLLRSHHALLLLPSDPTLQRSRLALLLLHSCPKILHSHPALLLLHSCPTLLRSRSALLLLDSPILPRRLLLDMLHSLIHPLLERHSVLLRTLHSTWMFSCALAVMLDRLTARARVGARF
ncbi:unnamed protein product [Closterium sp. NIES-53]